MVLYEDNAPNLAAAVITICILGYTSFSLRVYSRTRFGSWGIEDWAMTAALPFFTVLSIACIACAFTGVGATNKTLSIPGNEKYQEQGLFWFFLFEVFYCINIIPVKISISLMLIRIAQNLIAGLYIIFQCNPVSAAWDQSLLQKGGHCNDARILTDIYYATTAVNIFTDWITAFMPIPLLWNVQLNINSKISVAFILGLGFIASLSACIRLKYTVGLTDSENYLYSISDIVIWGYAENGLGLIAGCVATLKPLFRKTFRLSESNSKPTLDKYDTGNSYGFRSNPRRGYTEFEDEHELSSPSVHCRGDKDGDSFETENQDRILKGGNNQIFVKRQIEVTRG
ncbi:hypothetical protein F5X99DRAFT_409805 [Biscogniauxia marginata]|nr:hypothetical protein F5X99DRAFT_409805 [Biscogniauxia marginata]